MIKKYKIIGKKTFFYELLLKKQKKFHEIFH